MIKLLLVAILTAVLALALWLGVSTALDLIGIWQKHEIDPDAVLRLGVWFAAGGGFAAPLILHFTFKTIYRPRRKAPQLQKAPLRPKGARKQTAEPQPAAAPQPPQPEPAARKAASVQQPEAQEN